MTTPDRPALRILTSDTTAEEVAALVAVLAALGSREESPERRPRRTWNHPERLVRATYAAGPGGWRASGLPR